MARKTRQKLSQLELLILSAVGPSERYGLEIVRTLQNLTNAQHLLSLGSLYTTLHRMERKGLVSARWGETTEVRQGARRRYYRITGLGHRALTETKELLVKSLNLVPIAGTAGD